MREERSRIDKRFAVGLIREEMYRINEGRKI
jgi:hypothetical protein